jgi:two-component system chemotaxis response regulator CheB
LPRHDVEVLILDIEMPIMDGLTALPRLIGAKPDLQIIVSSTLTRRNADISMRALAAGATDYVTKPDAQSRGSLQEFNEKLLEKVKALAGARRRTRKQPLPSRAGIATRVRPAAPPAVATPQAAPQLRAMPDQPFEALAIGSSTGGPQALFSLFASLRGAVRQPIFLTQHMPPTFTTILGEHITRQSGMPAAEAVDGEAVRRERIYIAPGGIHMAVTGGPAEAKTIRLDTSPPENFCRPSVDVMLRSLAAAYGRRLLCVILTGMGHDGLQGGRVVVGGGGALIAQDEKSSVVWGMPGAVARAGLCSAVLPLAEIGPVVRKLAGWAG